VSFRATARNLLLKSNLSFDPKRGTGERCDEHVSKENILSYLTEYNGKRFINQLII
jgi:hypothetical protein